VGSGREAVTLVVQPSRYLHYNAGAFVSSGEACLADPGILREETEALVEAVGGAVISSIVLTHADWDHVLGPEHLPPVPIVAHASFTDDLDVEGTRRILAKLEQHAGATRTRAFEPPLPTKTFEDSLELRVGELELLLEHAPGHSRSMLTIYDPVHTTLWAADVLSDVELPSLIDDLEGYERTLEHIAALQVTTLVPGHGNRADDSSEITRRIDEDRAYLAALRADVSAAVAAGRSLDETVLACGSISFARSDDDAETHRLNVEKVYADLGGDADPDEVGYAQAWKEQTAAGT
jgi:glyoxylase-like metal-dependent hydrolase (beta-lactamase superfamily II)